MAEQKIEIEKEFSERLDWISDPTLSHLLLTLRLSSEMEEPFISQMKLRLKRVRLGLLGDQRSIGEGVFELRLDFGPGYRIYFGRRA